MKQTLTILFFLLLCSLSHGQNANNNFTSTKGKWNFPISNVLAIDTIGRDCLGMPYPSSSLVLKTNSPGSVTALQPGIVQGIHNFDGTYTVMVRSGEYFLFYLGLKNLQVLKGDSVTKNSELGVLAKDYSDTYAYGLELMLWKGGKPININRWFHWQLDPCNNHRISH